MKKRVLLPLCTTAALATVTVTALGYFWARSSVAKDIYRDRLTTLQADYQQLAEQYNQAITPRPVTELLVEEGLVCVIVRKANGETHRTQTPFNGWDNEIYVDYVLADRRLLIRRVFEVINEKETSAPVLVDESLAEVQWSDAIPFGKAIYRSRMADGRWIISVTGDGSLGLKQISDDTTITLATQPEIKKFEPVDQKADQAVDRIGIADVWQHLID